MNSWRVAEPNTPSPALNLLLTKLHEKSDVPRVNLPALARRDSRFMQTWKADPGRVFVSSDFSSLEPSITAHFSEDPYYRYATYEGIGKLPHYDHTGVLCIDDVYLMTASVMPGIRDTVMKYFVQPEFCERWLTDADGCKSEPEVKKARNRAKPACLGFNYGMRAKKFRSQCYDTGIDISLDEAQEMYKAYWDLYRGIKGLVEKISKHIETKKHLVNPFGYRLSAEPHKGYNAFIQSAASGVVDVLAMKFFSRCTFAEFVAFIHDEIIYHVPEARLEEARQIQAECVAELNQDLGWSVPMRLGFTPGKTFAEFK